MDTSLSERLKCTRIALARGDADAANAPWNAHPSFEGVSMKHLLTADDTEQRFSCHMVRVEPGCALLMHAHADQTELHVVLDGDGECTLCDRGVAYAPGSMAVIPQGSDHAVVAGQDGLTILAQFTPPLL